MTEDSSSYGVQYVRLWSGDASNRFTTDYGGVIIPPATTPGVYKDNAHFSNTFLRPLHFPGEWEAAVHSYAITYDAADVANPPYYMQSNFINVDCVVPQLVGSQQVYTLARFTPPREVMTVDIGQKLDVRITPPLVWARVNSQWIAGIELSLTDATGQTLKLRKPDADVGADGYPTFVTLVFRQISART